MIDVFDSRVLAEIYILLPGHGHVIYRRLCLPGSLGRENAPSLIEQVHRAKRPLVIAQHGKSAAILMDVQEYEAMLKNWMS